VIVYRIDLGSQDELIVLRVPMGARPSVENAGPLVRH
jgi:hypothetical protein